MSEQEVHLTILRAFTAYILSFEHLSYPPYYWERVFFYAPTVENLAESHPQYFELLDGLVLWCVCCAPPECHLEVKDFTVFAAEKWCGSSSISPVMSSSNNLAIVVTATFGLTCYAWRKISELPSSPRGEGLALFFMSFRSCVYGDDYDYDGGTPQRMPWAYCRIFLCPYSRSVRHYV